MENSFRRIEKKYLLDEVSYPVARSILAQCFVEDGYGWQSVRNIYFDNENDEIIRHSLEKTVYKNKLRVRCYGSPQKSDKVYVELKKKYDGVIYKRRMIMTYEQLNGLDFKETNENVHYEQVRNEIVYFIEKYSLKPKIYIGYDRLALKSDKFPYIRITFDTNIKYRRDNLDLQVDEGCKYSDEPQYVMEIKTDKSMPLWLSKELSLNGIFPCAYSKYGKIYKKEMLAKEANYVWKYFI